jgi:hypothetical protein
MGTYKSMWSNDREPQSSVVPEVEVEEGETSKPVESDPTLTRISPGFMAAVPVAKVIAEKLSGAIPDIKDLPKKVGLADYKYYTSKDGPIRTDPETGIQFLANNPKIGVMSETGRLYERVIAPKGFDLFSAIPVVNPKDTVAKEWSNLVTPSLQLEEVYEPTFVMKDLDTNKEWLDNARIVYEHEEGKKYRKSDAQLSKWFKKRHSRLGNDMWDMGWTALDTRKMSDRTKNAFVNSMDMWDDTKASGRSALGATWQTISDPTTWGTALIAVGVKKLVRKYGWKKVNKWIDLMDVPALTKKALTEQVSKEAAEQWATKGFSKEITTQALSEAQKKAAKELGENALKAGAATTALWSGGYDAEYQWLNRSLGRDGWEEYKPWQTAQAVLMGAGIGGPVARQIGERAALMGSRRKLRNHQGRLDHIEYEKNRKDLQTTDSTIPNKTSSVDIESIAAEIQRDLALNGIVKLDIQGARATLRKHLEKIGAKGDAAKNLSYEDIEDIFSRYGIEIQQEGTKRGQFIGKKINEFGAGVIDPKTGRKYTERMWGRIKRKFSASSGLGRRFQSARRRYDSNSLKAERAIQKRLGSLRKAIEIDYGSKLKDITPEQFEVMDRFLRGHAEKLPKNVTNELRAMRGHLNYLQERLWDSGVLKKEYDKDGKLKDGSLAFKIRNSIDGKDPELWITRQYEVFDNPDWATKIGANLDVMSNARTFLRGRLRNNDEFKAIDNKAAKGRYTENGLEQFDYKKAGLTPEEIELHQAFIGKDGTLDKLMYEITHAVDEEGLFQMFSNQRPLGRKPLKILERRDDIPSQIRAVMGEYKEPFSNFQNSVMKLEQTIATYQYEKEIADLIRAGLLDGAGTFNEDLGRINLLQSRMPKRAGVSRPLADGLKVEESGINRPLDNMHGTNEVADAIADGNEIFTNMQYFRPLQHYLAQQAHTRLAKTVYNTGAIARNFLSAGVMAAGAGYINPRHLKAIPKIMKGMYKMSDPALQAHMEKGLYLGYIQSGTIMGQFRAALGEAADPSYWNGSNPLYKGGNVFKRKAKKYNIAATKFYQLMDDVWKEFGFLSEKDMQRPILRDTAHVAKAKRQAGEELTPEENDLLRAMDKQGGLDYDPELDIVHTFKSADGVDVNITRLDSVAADMVGKHMQNYAGVPQFVRMARLLPAADFLAFNTELARTMKDILWSSGSDMIEGNRVMKRGITLPDGTKVGQAQASLGKRRLGSQIAAQSSAAAVGGTSTWYLAKKAYDKTGDLVDWMRGEETLDDTTDAIESFDQKWAKGNQYMWLTEPKEGQGRRLNLSFQNPYAVIQDPLRGTMRDMANGTFNEKTVMQRVYDHALRPLFDMMGPSMWVSAVSNIYQNTDEYGRVIWDNEQNTTRQNVGNVLKEIWKPYEPGLARDAVRTVRSITDRPVDAEGNVAPYALKPGTLPRKYTTFDSILGLVGVRPEYYDIRNNMLGELAEQRSITGKSSQIFNRMIKKQEPINVDQLTEGYARSLEIQYRAARKMANTIERAKAAGLSNNAIIKYVTKDYLFADKLDKKMIMDLVNKGIFVPPMPNIKDMRKWEKYAKDNGLQIPPIKEAQKQLIKIWQRNLGMRTGSERTSPATTYKSMWSNDAEPTTQ